MNMQDAQNLALALDLFDNLVARAGSLVSGMRSAVAEDRDLTDDEVQGFRDAAETEDRNLGDAIEARRQREVIGRDSNKVTGDTGGDIRP